MVPEIGFQPYKSVVMYTTLLRLGRIRQWLLFAKKTHLFVPTTTNIISTAIVPPIHYPQAHTHTHTLLFFFFFSHHCHQPHHLFICTHTPTHFSISIYTYSNVKPIRN